MSAPPSEPGDPDSGSSRWVEVERVLDAALELDPEDWPDFLAAECGEEPEVRAEVESLLARYPHIEDFLREAPAELAYRPEDGREDSSSEGPGAAAPGRLRAGERLGPYRIEEPVGRGGMGVVYRANDPRLDRTVALKFLPPWLTGNEPARRRFTREAKAASALDHPNVQTVYEIAETGDGRPYIALAYYEGETLKERISRGPLPVDEAVDLASQLAEGLAAAHARGIVHRDVKPSNVIVTPDGVAKVLDFGIAEMVGRESVDSSRPTGTPDYMSPEQLRGWEVDGRSDLWSLGVVLYEMLTGVRPFRRGDDRALLEAIHHDDPEPVTTLRPEMPEPLARIVDRLLEKDPDGRFWSAGTLRAELAQAVSSMESLPRAAGATKSRWGAKAISISAVLVAITAGTLWLAGNGMEPPPTGAAPTEEPSIAVLPLTDLSADGHDAALADGMTEELTEILARAGGLRVIPSTSAFKFRDREISLRSIADSMDVRNILEGSLRREGERLRLRIRLVDGRDGSTRWSETYDREATDVFAVQGEIVRAVARELDLRLARGTGLRLLRHQTTNVAAYELYLRGTDQRLLRSDSGVRRGVQLLRQALAVDSTYAAAHAGLARMYFVLSSRDDPGMPIPQLRARAKQAALKAVTLDDSLAEAQAALAVVRWGIDYDFASAEAGLKRAIELDPTRALFHQWLAQLYIQTGRPREALAPAQRALEIAPMSATAHAEVAHALLANRRYDAALARIQHIEELRPPLLRAAPYAAQAYAGKGMWAEAIAALRPQAERRDRSRALGLYGYILGRAGRQGEARAIREILLDRWRQGEADAFEVAIVHAGIGELDRAFSWLDRSIDDRSAFHANTHIMEPIFEDLHRDPRFENLRSRLGLPN